MSEIKKKKVYLLKDRAGSDVKAELKDNGELRIEMLFPNKILEEEMLYETFVSLGWELKHEEFQPDIDNTRESVFIPPATTFH